MAQESLDGLVMEGEISVPYKWTTGKAVGRFLTALRDEKKILGSICPECDTILVPPQDFCGRCFVDTPTMAPVGDWGTLQTFTLVETPLVWRPYDPPYALGAIRLEGASTDLIHVIKVEDYFALRNGITVKAIWGEERSGSIMDISYFQPVEMIPGSKEAIEDARRDLGLD